MKTIITNIIRSLCFLIILLYCNTSFCQIEKLPYYKKALEYIKDNSFVQERYGEWITKNGSSPKYFVSKEVLYFEPRDFRSEIIDFQFKNLDSVTKISIEGFLDNVIRTKDIYRTDSLLLRLNNETEPNLILFFSRILWSGEYKLFTASIHIISSSGYNGDMSYLFTHKFYTEYTKSSNITFLFYMNDAGDIIKIFTKQFVE